MHLRVLARDQHFFTILEKFLSLGGLLKIGWGHYIASPLSLALHMPDDATLVKDPALSILVASTHELLHFVFDRTDSAILEDDLPRHSADHWAIYALEDRAKIVNALELGQTPIRITLKGLSNLNPKGALFGQLTTLVKDKKFDELDRAVSDPDFVKQFVQTSMTELLTTRKTLEANHGDWTTENATFSLYHYTEDQVQDLAYINAYSAVILQQTVRLGIRIQAKTGVEFADVFKTNDFQNPYRKFIKALADDQSNHPESSIQKSAKALMDTEISVLAK
jgi:hypothetical protein